MKKNFVLLLFCGILYTLLKKIVLEHYFFKEKTKKKQATPSVNTSPTFVRTRTVSCTFQNKRLHAEG